jgi:Zn-dependent protease
MGRLSLNPLVHIDPIGTVVFPLIPVFFSEAAGYLIGWMKPVPVLRMNLRRPGRDMLLVSLAGPFANLFLAFLGILVLNGFVWAGAEIPSGISAWIQINLALAFFNLLPIPPLDGSSIVDYIRKDESGRYHSQGFIGMMILYFLLMMGGLDYLWKAADMTFMAVGSSWMVSTGVFVVLAVLGGLFLTASSTKPRRQDSRKTGSTKSMQVYEKARMIGMKLKEGSALTKSEEDWLEKLRRDRGDGESLCSPISFHGENDFCAVCANLNRCAIRLIESHQNGG